MADQQVLDDFFARAKTALDLPAATYEDAYQLGGPEFADELAALVKNGQKTATTSGFELYTIEQDPLPIAGVYNIILDRQDRPVALTYTDNVFVTPFAKVDATIARREGEGSKSLASWRKIHEDFFRNEYHANGIQFDSVSSMVVVEEFHTVFPIVQTR
ncbi:RNA-binding protein [Lacticaseibacillus chiayiensis]|uniref:ASCH domain-containing protein n=1 Tax=Lacticaseibacillus chiayiensis TaxID=2100821 RepID=A0A4Q1TKG3_9LACO|nr:ASCH domain-containing protein [Lacticaseibacillus chiayiensis]QVI33544.1 ASCH domain-containing protein [Lacticaseibacillus chiayiensis]RXT19069.1 RNA-binding protein [Lacticaseibacillus chiayiensis]RXT58187.1 RNA-binding protein [Lacticaseibacillus chiayiensis]UYN55288.1 ASCH domain-containing protein [Lacticaseibacillus chiayiensis]